MVAREQCVFTLPSEQPMIFAAAAIAILLAGFTYWQVTGPASTDFAEIDMGLLTDELPLNAYLDKGFDSWLKRSSR